MDRRSFLIAATGLTVSSLVAGCNQKGKANILLLQGSIPAQLIGTFRQQFDPSRSVVFKPESNIQDIYDSLLNWQGKAPPTAKKNASGHRGQIPYLVTLGNYWLTGAIQQELIAPLSGENISNWQNLPGKFREIVTRNLAGNLAASGQIWGIPYRWGCTMIAYRREQFERLGWQPTDWHDLWRPEVRDRISLLNQPREVIGLILKKLGHSYNSANLEQIPQLKSELRKLKQQVKFYGDTNYLQPLILGDTWLAVGWSSDILPIMKRYSNIEAAIPQSGTALWADLWVKPKKSGNNSHELAIMQNWLDFCLSSEAANQISLFSNAASPTIFALKAEDLARDIIDNQLIYPDATILEKSEFILPLSKTIEQQYLDLYQS